jgi:hypothetical protein
LEILQTNDFVSIILSAEVLFTVIFTISLFVAVHAPMGFMRQSNSLFTRLAQIEAELNVLLATIPGKLERMRDNLAPLQAEFKEIQAYFRRLQHMDRRWLAQQAKRAGRRSGQGPPDSTSANGPGPLHLKFRRSAPTPCRQRSGRLPVRHIHR